ncbi:MAG TPA: hypothetical protein VGN40_13100 [Lelliottia sp.]|jgi:predicted Rossmann fold nucleotide-binding protein DprA/Smf involved in DNA uptake
MSVKLVIQTLKNRNMAFCRDIARSSGITEEETITALLHLEQDGMTAQRNGYWWLTPTGEKFARSKNQ